MTRSSDSRARGAMLMLALALVGGTGCVVIDAANKNRYERQQRDAEADRQRRIAGLAPAAGRVTRLRAPHSLTCWCRRRTGNRRTCRVRSTCWSRRAPRTMPRPRRCWARCWGA